MVRFTLHSENAALFIPHKSVNELQENQLNFAVFRSKIIPLTLLRNHYS